MRRSVCCRQIVKPRDRIWQCHRPHLASSLSPHRLGAPVQHPGDFSTFQTHLNATPAAPRPTCGNSLVYDRASEDSRSSKKAAKRTVIRSTHSRYFRRGPPTGSSTSPHSPPNSLSSLTLPRDSGRACPMACRWSSCITSTSPAQSRSPRSRCRSRGSRRDRRRRHS